MEEDEELEMGQYVELIASGYDWTCPNCDHDNHEVSLTTTVQCEECEKEYYVLKAHHAL